MYQCSLSQEVIDANREFYLATLKHLFLERGRPMSETYLLRRESMGVPDRYSRTVYLLGANGLEPAYYNYDIKQWIRSPKNKDVPLLTNKYIEPAWGLDQMAERIIFSYMIGNSRVSDVAYRTSHKYKDT